MTEQKCICILDVMFKNGENKIIPISSFEYAEGTFDYTTTNGESSFFNIDEVDKWGLINLDY